MDTCNLDDVCSQISSKISIKNCDSEETLAALLRSRKLGLPLLVRLAS